MSFTPTKIEPEHLVDIVESIKHAKKEFNQSFVVEHLYRFYDVINTALTFHKRVLGVSFTLSAPVSSGAEIINRFIDEFRVNTHKELKVRKKESDKRHKLALAEFRKIKKEQKDVKGAKEPKRPNKVGKSHFTTKIGHFFTRRVSKDGKTNIFTGMIFLNRDSFGDVNPRCPKRISKKLTIMNPTRVQKMISKIWLPILKEHNTKPLALNISYYLLDRGDKNIHRYIEQTIVKAASMVEVKNQLGVIKREEDKTVFNSVLKFPMPVPIKRLYTRSAWKYEFIENTTFSLAKDFYLQPKKIIRMIYIEDTYYGKKRRKLLNTRDIEIDENIFKEYFCEMNKSKKKIE